jgi:hypothetical protein
MDDYDPADFDGDGEFDGIDIAFLEDEDGNKKKEPARGNSGCCIVLLAIGFSIGIGYWCVSQYFVDHFIGYVA